MIGYSGDIQTAGFQQNLLNKIKYGGQTFFHDYSVILEPGPLSKDKSFPFCEKQTNRQQLQQMTGKEKEDIYFVDYCRSRKFLLRSSENKMAYEDKFKQSSLISNNHLSQ